MLLNSSKLDPFTTLNVLTSIIIVIFLRAGSVLFVSGSYVDLTGMKFRVTMSREEYRVLRNTWTEAMTTDNRDT